MITRRSLLRGSISLGFAALLGRKSDAQILRDPLVYNGYKEPFEKSPHAEALALVFQRQKYSIRDIETRFAMGEHKKEKCYIEPESDWWFDTHERQWKVYRPCAPGTIDSTHGFCVSYFINENEVGRWSVDTAKGTVDDNLDFIVNTR